MAATTTHILTQPRSAAWVAIAPLRSLISGIRITRPAAMRPEQTSLAALERAHRDTQLHYWG